MLRTRLSLGVVAVLMTAAGCTMCCHPYDYCGPVHTDHGCQSCSTRARTGSILAETSDVAPSLELAHRPVPSNAVADKSLHRQIQGDIRPGDVPGSQQIVSVTDRVVDPSASPADSPQVAAQPSSEASKPLSAAGWTARRPTPESAR
jgi:hypothetical protein